MDPSLVIIVLRNRSEKYNAVGLRSTLSIHTATSTMPVRHIKHEPTQNITFYILHSGSHTSSLSLSLSRRDLSRHCFSVTDTKRFFSLGYDPITAHGLRYRQFPHTILNLLSPLIFFFFISFNVSRKPCSTCVAAHNQRQKMKTDGGCLESHTRDLPDGTSMLRSPYYQTFFFFFFTLHMILLSFWVQFIADTNYYIYAECSELEERVRAF